MRDVSEYSCECVYYMEVAMFLYAANLSKGGGEKRKNFLSVDSDSVNFYQFRFFLQSKTSGIWYRLDVQL